MEVLSEGCLFGWCEWREIEGFLSVIGEGMEFDHPCGFLSLQNLRKSNFIFCLLVLVFSFL